MIGSTAYVILVVGFNGTVFQALLSQEKKNYFWGSFLLKIFCYHLCRVDYCFLIKFYLLYFLSFQEYDHVKTEQFVCIFLCCDIISKSLRSQQIKVNLDQSLKDLSFISECHVNSVICRRKCIKIKKRLIKADCSRVTSR